MAIGHPAKSRCPLLYAILLTGRVQSLAQRPAPLRPQHRPCACRMTIGHPAKLGCPILYAILPTGRVQSLAQLPAPLRPQYRPCACCMAIGHPAKSGCPFLYTILPTGESNRRFSVQTPSGRSIGPALIAWQSGILQSRSARFCMLSFRSESLIADLAFSPSQTVA